ncbi:MAG: hypothetical protein H6Q03_2550, partial [Acidobacteria bacterium]|nr:hypothetical protein [Acidobacteriota bacterium]
MKKDPEKSPEKSKARPAAEVSKLLDLEPDRLPVTERRAKYLAELAGVEAKAIAGKTIAEV